MKHFLIFVLATLAIGCQPSYAVQIEKPSSVQVCVNVAGKFSHLVNYKDAGIPFEDVVAELNTKESAEDRKILRVLTDIYENDLTHHEVYRNIYLTCINGYTI